MKMVAKSLENLLNSYALSKEYQNSLIINQKAWIDEKKAAKFI